MIEEVNACVAIALLHCWPWCAVIYNNKMRCWSKSHGFAAHVSNAAFGVLTGGLAICQLLDKQLGLSGEKAINFHTWKIQVYNIYIYHGNPHNLHFVHGLFLGPRDVFPGGGAAPSTFLGSTTSLRSNAKCHGDTWAKCRWRSSTENFFVVWLEGFLGGRKNVVNSHVFTIVPREGVSKDHEDHR